MEYIKRKIGFLTYSNIEVFDIFKAWIAISIAFGIVLGGLTTKFFTAFLISAIAVGLGFLLHELNHKFVAQKYRFKAEFRSFDEMLFLAIVMSFFGFVIAAPGAVMIQSNFHDKTKAGKISVAGPIMNLILASLFFIILILLTGSISGAMNLNGQISKNVLDMPLIYAIPIIGFSVNSWLALFNMIPFWIFDGAKIFSWNKTVWGLVTLISIAFVFLL
ncbi:hypothetical protein J4440_03905 [Candidatus Woesearchaeota archaeon]|nr:hypothetical protein [Candidatus Woesearchaeota archaeon]